MRNLNVERAEGQPNTMEDKRLGDRPKLDLLRRKEDHKGKGTLATTLQVTIQGPQPKETKTR